MQADPRENRIDYVELPASSIKAGAEAKRFYGDVFGWVFQDYGDDYSDTKSSGIASGINAASGHRPARTLVVLFSSNLEAAKERVMKSGGKISRDIFSFPGGRRFHFIDLSGNELGVWSDK